MLGNAAQKTLPNTDPKTMTHHGTSRHKVVTFNGRYTPTTNEPFLNHIQNTPPTCRATGRGDKRQQEEGGDYTHYNNQIQLSRQHCQYGTNKRQRDTDP